MDVVLLLLFLHLLPLLFLYDRHFSLSGLCELRQTKRKAKTCSELEAEEA